MTETFEQSQQFEAGWWGTCANTYGEETKQLTYAHRMGLVVVPHAGKWPVYDLDGRSVLDLGGGPASMLLKVIRGGRLMVVDPCPYPKWVAKRYDEAGIVYLRQAAEDFDLDVDVGRAGLRHPDGTVEYVGPPAPPFDEAWIYNVLQHVIDPEEVIATARASANRVRIFEWANVGPHPGHPHMLRPADLDRWLGGTGTMELVNENGCVGTAYYGVFDAAP